MFDPAEKERIKYHMGYTGQSTAAGLSYGLPIPVQTMFLVESAIDRLNAFSEDRVRKLITVLDKIECKMEGGLDNLEITRIESIEMRADQLDKLEDEYCRWASRLADVVGSPLYPGATKFKRLHGVGGANMAGSIPVRG